MTHITGHDRYQMLLLPERVDDYVAGDNPVRFIDAFVDGLDLARLGFARVVPEATGRPGYAPGDLLKLYIYGYLNRARSSRRLEAETHRNLEVIWLLRHLKPDFKTIADFRRDNRAAFRSVFREFVLLCRQLDLFGRELLAVDGTRIKAVNNKNRNFTRTSLTDFIRDADDRLANYVRRLDEADAVDNNAGSGPRTPNLAEKIAALRAARDRHRSLLAELERTGESQISLTDPDSRAMAGHTRVAVGYNAQLAVDAKYKLIVEQEVTNQVVDMGLLKQTAEPARAILGVERIDVVADRGYFKIEDIAACDEAGLIPHVPKPQRGSGVRRGFFHKDEFLYDPERDVFTCPGRQTLEPHHHGRLRDLQRIGYSNPAACPRRIDALFEIERSINGDNAERRRAVRQELSAPLVTDLERWLREHRPKLSRGNDLAKAMDYVLKRWPAFTRFLNDGRVCLSNNAAERALRGIALGRKSWLFAGSDRGGQRAAAMYSLIITAKLNDIDPQAWLADVLARIAAHPAHDIDALLPWNWQPSAASRRQAA